MEKKVWLAIIIVCLIVVSGAFYLSNQGRFTTQEMEQTYEEYLATKTPFEQLTTEQTSRLDYLEIPANLIDAK